MRSGKKFALGFLPSLLVVVAMLLAACGGGSAPGNTGAAKAPASQQVFRYGMNGGNGVGDITTFDPALDADQPSEQAIANVFTGMVELDNNLQVVPQLATSWDHTGTTWTFHLRHNLTFSDGTTLDANDVAYSINRASSASINNLSGGLAATYLGLLKDFSKFNTNKISTLIGDSIIVKDPNTIELVLDHDTGYFLQALAYPTAWVVEKSVIQKYGDTKWTDHLADNGGQGGDGPWKVLSYDHNTGIKFVPNPKYYGKQPALRELDYTFIKNANTGFKAYQAKQIDYTPVAVADLPQAKASLSSQLKIYPIVAIRYIGLNALYKPFDNLNIRQAFELAINKDVLNTATTAGLNKPSCQIVPSGLGGYNNANLKCPQGAPTSGNIALAKQLLMKGMQEEGITTLPKLTLTSYANSPTYDKVTAAIRQMWQDNLGATVGYQTLDFGALVKAEQQTACATPNNVQACMGKGLQMYVAGWISDYPDPQDWLTLQFDKSAPNNETNFGQNTMSDAAAQQQAQTAMENADVMPAGNARLQAYYAPEQQAVNDVAWLTLWQNNFAEVVNPKVAGWTDNAQQIIAPDYWSQIYITQ